MCAVRAGAEAKVQRHHHEPLELVRLQGKNFKDYRLFFNIRVIKPERVRSISQ